MYSTHIWLSNLKTYYVEKDMEKQWSERAALENARVLFSIGWNWYQV